MQATWLACLKSGGEDLQESFLMGVLLPFVSAAPSFVQLYTQTFVQDVCCEFSSFVLCLKKSYGQYSSNAEAEVFFSVIQHIVV